MKKVTHDSGKFGSPKAAILNSDVVWSAIEQTPSQAPSVGKPAWMGVSVIMLAVMGALVWWWPGVETEAKSQPPVMHFPDPDEGPEATFPVIQPHGRFIVRAGSFTQSENARRVVSQLLQVGVTPRMQKQKVSRGELIHVFVGPFATEAEAETASVWIRSETGLPVDFAPLTSASGKDPQVSSRTPPPTATASVKTITLPDTKVPLGTKDLPEGEEGQPILREGDYVVMAGSFSNLKNANRIHQRLAALNMPARLKTSHVSDRVFTHVLVGPYTKKTEAEQALAGIRKKTGIVAEFMRIR